MLLASRIAWYCTANGILARMYPATLLLGHTLEGFQAACPDLAAHAAAEMYHAFHRDGAHPEVSASSDRVVAVEEEHGVQKFLLKHADGQDTESVIMPIEGRSGRIRHTLCVSSQVGCAMGCTFCQTATLGRIRQLTAAEIVAQWHCATHAFNTPISNIVFMGMGEPMDNLDAVLTSIEVLTDHHAASIAPSRIGVSTVGHAHGIRRFTQFMQRDGMHQIRLAVSVNASNEDVRRSIMPMARGVNMTALREAMQGWIDAGGRPILIEYVLIPTVNDHPEAADELAQWLGELPCRVNVIPYNPKQDSPWPAPSEDSVTQFVQTISKTGLAVNRRRTMGRTVMAACGQLGAGQSRT